MKVRFALLTGLALSVAFTPMNLSAQVADKAAGAAKTVAKDTGKVVEKAAEKTADTAGAAAKKSKNIVKGGPTQNASVAEIADAKAKGLVWVNTGTGVYHKDGEYFGATKEGKFMTAADADKAGFHAAGGHKTAKAKTPKK